MEGLPPNQSTKRKNRPLKVVTVLCTKCRSAFTTKARAHLCPNCRPVKGQYAVNPKPQLQPLPQRPQRPNRPRPQKRPQQNQQQVAQAADRMQRLNLNLNPASRLANRTSQGATLLRPSRGARSAVERLLLHVLDPAASCGQRAIRINVDQIQLPKFPIQFDNNFVVQSLSGNYKIMLIASPIVSAVIYGSPGDVTVGPNRTLTVDGDNGQYTYVLNSKIGFLADMDPRYILSVKEDFRRFRMISASMQSQWSGPELFKNGVAVTARITDKENLAEFDPNSKADNVISNVSDVLVVTCQHSEPVFEFSPVDANNDDGGGNLPDPDKSQYATYTYEVNTKYPFQVLDGLTQPSPTLSTTNATTTAETISQWLTSVAASMSTDQNINYTSNRIITALANKYPNFASEGYSVSATTSYSCIVKFSVTLRPKNTTKKIVASATFNGMPDTTTGDFFRQLLLRARDYITDATQPGALTGIITDGSFNVELLVPIDGKIEQRLSVPWPIGAPLISNELTSTPFYDDNFLQPVTQILGSGDFQTSIQYQTSHLFEFVLGDTTVLATAAVANTPTDAESTVSKAHFNRFQKIMKGMPPAHILSDVGMTRTTMSQFASRGILNDIFNLAAPIAGALFPGVKPFLTAAKPLVTAIDGAL